jgi:DNA repair exonuclease SbcCD ATPase subunit
VRYRLEFEGQLGEARAASAVRAAQAVTDANGVDAQIEAAAQAFEVWLSDERRGTANRPAPNPLALVKRYVPAEEKKLRDEVAALSSALTQAKASEEELGTAKAEITQLSEQLALESRESERLREENAATSLFLQEAKLREEELREAKAEIARLSGRLSALSTDVRQSSASGNLSSSPRWALTATAAVVGAIAGALATNTIDRAAKMEANLNTSRSESRSLSAQPGGCKSAELQQKTSETRNPEIDQYVTWCLANGL